VRKILFLLTLCLTAPALITQPSEELFAQANQLYKDGKFKAAQNLYQQIPSKSAWVNYNLGNCAFQLKSYGYALLHWRRAEKDWGFFNREELLDNISLLQEKLNKEHGITLTTNPIIRALVKTKNVIDSWLRSMPLIILQLFFIFIWLFLFLYLRFLYKKRKNRTIVTLFSLIAFFGIILAVRYSLDARRYGVIVSSEAKLLSGPGDTFQVLQSIREAQEVIIKKETPNYYKVKIRRQLGWMKRDFVEKI